MDYPDYSYPRGLIMEIALDVLLLRQRNFRQDAMVCIENLRPALRVLGRGNIPRHGPCVVTVNHNHRVGFGAQWFALAIAATVPVDMYWTMTGEFTYPGKWYQLFGEMGSRLLLRRIAGIYGFTTMPPMPPRLKDVAARATSVRAVLDAVRHAKDPVLGLAPEGGDSADGKLARPASGVGRFGLLLSGLGLSFVPVGAYEEHGIFIVHFGEAYRLNVDRDLSIAEKDKLAIQAIMGNIARLLPSHLRGEFS